MIAIIADLHDHLVNFRVFLKKIAETSVDELWIAGDVGTSETLAIVAENFSATIRAVAGNVELGHGAEEYEAVTKQFPHLIWSKTAPLVWQSTDRSASISQVAMYHHPPSARRLGQNPPAQLVVSGHTHRPSLEKRDNTWLLNPGTLGGVFSPATYALADLTKPTFTLHRLYE